MKEQTLNSLAEAGILTPSLHLLPGRKCGISKYPHLNNLPDDGLLSGRHGTWKGKSWVSVDPASMDVGLVLILTLPR